MIRFFRVCLLPFGAGPGKTWSQYSDELSRVCRQLQLGGRLKQMLSGIGRLSKQKWRAWPQVLGQSSETYLVEAGYLSESREIIDGTACVNISSKYLDLCVQKPRKSTLWGGVPEVFQ